MSPDAGNPVDSGSDTGTVPEGLDRFIAGGGCHCATAPGQGGATPWLAGLLALVVLFRRRRR